MLAALLDFFFPRMCPICGNRLELDERPLCLRCNIDMPRTMFWEHPYDNPLARMYWGKIPISISRRMARGYNQSEMIARGISKATGIPIEKHAVIRRYFSRSQTHLTREERRENVSDVFVLKDADAVKGRHVLLIDDIITTGATTISCASEILKAGNVNISILSLGYASKAKAQDVHQPKII